MKAEIGARHMGVGCWLIFPHMALVEYELLHQRAHRAWHSSIKMSGVKVAQQRDRFQ